MVASVSHGDSNGVTVAEAALMTEADILQGIANAKLVLIAEQAMILTVYAIKVCMLIVYSRLTYVFHDRIGCLEYSTYADALSRMGLKERVAVKMLGIYVLAGFVATEITMFTACIPFNKYYALPPGDEFIEDCAFYKKYSIAQAVFNITSDGLMLAIPLPLLIRSRLALKQKIAMVIIFSMGIFIILAAVLSKAIALLPENSTSIVYAFWYLRESSVAIYVANLPLLWPTIRVFLSWISLKSGYASSGAAGSRSVLDGRTVELKSATDRRRLHSQRLPDQEVGAWNDNSSQEQIINNGGIMKTEVFEIKVTENLSHGQPRIYNESTPDYEVKVN
jgi:hypothetical protein